MSDPKTWKRAAGAASLVATGLVAGGILAGTLSASAADTGTTTTSTDSATSTPVDPSQPQRPDETLLTGDTKSQVVKAVLAKYPDATIERTETDSDRVYESHIVTSDGQHVIVQVDDGFALTGTQTGGGGGHHGPDDDTSGETGGA
jgi:ABC-type glycerol-3-phosphate transport system substrate-binding protein